MEASYNNIKSCLYAGDNGEYSHLLIVCDTFDYEDYPVYIKKDEDIKGKILQYSQNMQKVMEVFNYSIDLEYQLAETRARHIDITDVPSLKLRNQK